MQAIIRLRCLFGVKVQCALLNTSPAQPSMGLDSLSPVVPVLLPGHEVWMTCKVPVSQAMFISTGSNRTCGTVSELAVHAAVTYMPCPGHLSLEAVWKDQEAAWLTVAQQQSSSSSVFAPTAGATPSCATPGCVVVLTADDYFGVGKAGSSCDMKESLFARRQTVEAKWGKGYLPLPPRLAWLLCSHPLQVRLRASRGGVEMARLRTRAVTWTEAGSLLY